MKPQNYGLPQGYRVYSYCTTCGKDFAGGEYFDRHRIGRHEYTYSEGLNFYPPREDGRRCKTTEELLEEGMRPMTEQEMLATRRHKHRVGYGIELWFDPIRSDRVGKHFNDANEQVQPTHFGASPENS